MALNAITYAGMMRMLMDGEYMRNEIAIKTGLHAHTVCRYVEWLHKKKVVYICDWRQNPVNNNWIPVYTLNTDGEADVPKPKDKPRAQVYKEYRERKKQRAIMRMMAGV